jgi:hypothetical protein
MNAQEDDCKPLRSMLWRRPDLNIAPVVTRG